MANSSAGKRAWQQLVDAQNTILQAEGEIQRNDTRLWRYLAKGPDGFDDIDWTNLLYYFHSVVRVDHPDVITESDVEIFELLVCALPEQPQAGNFTLYGKPYKSTEEKNLMWRALRRCNEIDNAITGVHITNHPGAGADYVRREQQAHTFNQLFKQE